MNAFEIVLTLLTMVTSLALAHLLNGFVIVLRHAKQVQFSMLHGIWSWIALAVLIGNWASFWQMRNVETWPSVTVLLLLAAATVQYLFCAFVTPEMEQEGKLNLKDFHAHSHRLYILAFIMLLFISLLLNLVLGGMKMYENWWHDSILTIVAMLQSSIAIFVNNFWVQLGVAIVNASIVTYYLILSCNFVAS
ncbi:MAG: hypothetical protein KDC24_11570 [Saprospiraceae bacterium]|nr:hypothetical protein [Saprospiraceae bacterium]